jgi:predicted MFS family arabinose efflux permease
LAGIVAGFVAGIVALLAISFVGDLLFPMTAEIDARDPEQVTGAFSSSPTGAKLMLLAALFGAAFVGAWVADRIALRRWAGWPLALVLTLFAIAVIFLVALPAWMQIALVLAPLLGVLVASHALPRRLEAPAEEPGAADAAI